MTSYSHLTRYDLEGVLSLLAEQHPNLVQEMIAQQQRDKVNPTVTRIEVGGDYLYPSFSSYYQDKLQRYLEEYKAITIDPCFKKCKFCKRYYGPKIYKDDVLFDQNVDQEAIDAVRGLSEDLEEKLIEFLDKYGDDSEEEVSDE